MTQRLSVNLLLKSVILTLSAAIVVVLSLGAWNSWQRQATVRRIAGVVETSASFFTALHNMRSDRTTTVRELIADRVNNTPPDPLRKLRDIEMSALKAGLASLATVDFPGREAAVASLDKAIKKLAALHQETAAAMAQPKASRKATLAKEYFDEVSGLIEFLDKLGMRIMTSSPPSW